MEKIMQKKPELLAPAGTPETAIAAADAGADAVYCGLGRFNARERAGNFTADSLGRTIEFFHRSRKKVYLTLNTMVMEPELPAFVETVSLLRDLAPDAVIVQDPGVIWLLRELIPELPLHGSTQMGIHNHAGIAAAASMGMRRVILERQVTLPELRKILPASPLEIEVFLHGSLCCSLSGRCYLSGFCGGWSGNRGKCKQLCRRRYADDSGRRGFYLSPGDLSAAEVLPELIRLGVASLKIEGRLRGPEYVWKTVRAYRLLLDDFEDNYAEAMELLRTTTTRELSPAFFADSIPQKLVRPERPGYFGTEVGQILAGNASGMEVKLIRRLHVGDRLRILPPDGGESVTGFELARMTRDRKPATVASAGDKVFLPGHFSVSPGWLLVKTGENGFDFSRQTAALPSRRFPVKLELRLTQENWSATALVAGTKPFRWECKVDFAAAKTHGFQEEEAKNVFLSGAPEPWRPEIAALALEPGFFAPAGEVKALRRKFWAAFKEAVPAGLADRSAGVLSRFCQLRPQPRPEVPVFPAEWDTAERFVLPGFIAEADLPLWEKKLADAVRRGVRIAEVRGWHGFPMVKPYPQLKIISGEAFPLANSFGVRLLQELGAHACTIAPELDAEAAEMLRRDSGLPLQERGAEDLPLLVSRLPLHAGTITDARGNHFTVRYDAKEKLSKLYSADHDPRRVFRDGKLK